jgi:hypothetical protein
VAKEWAQEGVEGNESRLKKEGDEAGEWNDTRCYTYVQNFAQVSVQALHCYRIY